MIRRVFWIMALAINASAWAFILYFFLSGHFRAEAPSGFELLRQAVSPTRPAVEYKDFVSILLTALGLMIAILAAVLALAAIWGFNVLKEEILRVADKSAREKAYETSIVVSRELALQSSQFADAPGTDYGEAAASGGADATGSEQGGASS